MKRQWVKVLIWSVVGLVILGGGWVFVKFTYGYTWSFENWANLKLLREVPAPPGISPMGKYREGTAIQPVVYRGYWIPLEDMSYNEIVTFFEGALPSAGWEFVDEARCTSDVSDVSASSDHIRITKLIYTCDNQHWLYVSIVQRVDMHGNPLPTEDHTSVRLGLSRYQDYVIEKSGIDDIHACVRGIEQ